MVAWSKQRLGRHAGPGGVVQGIMRETAALGSVADAGEPIIFRFPEYLRGAGRGIGLKAYHRGMVVAGCQRTWHTESRNIDRSFLRQDDIEVEGAAAPVSAAFG
jgi:hypothetical protein